MTWVDNKGFLGLNEHELQWMIGFTYISYWKLYSDGKLITPF